MNGFDGRGQANEGDPVSQTLQRIYQAGIGLDCNAMQALTTLSTNDILELLQHLLDHYPENPSKFVADSIIQTSTTKSLGGIGGAFLGTSAPSKLSIGVGGAGTSAPSSIGAGSSGNGFLGTSVPSQSSGGGGFSDLPSIDRLLERAKQVGLSINGEALSAIAGLPSDHAAELLEFVLEKAPELRDPSNYIMSTIARGFKPRRSMGSSQRAGASSSTSTSFGGQSSFGGGAPADSQDVISQGLQRLSELGLQIDDSARQALATLSAEHASEMIDYVAENYNHLRNPSNYISSTVARGFVPRGQKGSDKGKGGKGGGSAGNFQHVPNDVSLIERRATHINSNLAPEMRIDFVTYLALRCLPEWQAADLLDGLEMRISSISNPCNYLQAAVTKIQRGDKGKGKGGYGELPAIMDHPDNKRQRMW